MVQLPVFSLNIVYNVKCNIIKTAFPTICYISFVDLFYIPSFLRGEGSNRMAVLEPWRSVGMPRGSQGEGMNVLTHRPEEQHVNHTRGLTITL